MEAVLSYGILFVNLVGHTEHISLFGHCLVEGCIEDNRLGNICGNYLLAGTKCKCMTVVMYGSKLSELVDFVDNLVCNKNGGGENLCALDDSVAYCRDFAHVLDNGCVACCKNLNNLFKSLGMCGEFAVRLIYSAVKGGVLDMSADADSLAIALGNYLFVCHLNKLVLKR